MEHVGRGSQPGSSRGPAGQARRPGDPRPGPRGHRAIGDAFRYAPTCSDRRFPWPITTAPTVTSEIALPQTREELLELHAVTRKQRNGPPHGSPEHVGGHRPPRAHRGRDRPHRAGHGPAARLTACADARPHLRGRAARRPPERSDADRDGDQGALHRTPCRRGSDRDRGDIVRRAAGDPPTGRRGRAAADPAPPPRAALPGARAQHARHGPCRGRRRRCDRGLHRGHGRLHRGEHRDDGRGVARGLRAGPRACRRAGLVASGVRLDRVRVPLHRPRRTGPGRRGRRPPGSSSVPTRSASGTRSASASRARWPC